jgi:hypothetical protein
MAQDHQTLGLFYMLTRNDQPYLDSFNFGVDSVFNNVQVTKSDVVPILPNEFLLLDTEFFFLLDGTQFLLLGT